jgi:hypothetical protein
MPFVIVNGPTSADKSVEATLCEANLLGQPDRRSRVPVLVRQISERVLLIEPDDPREIVSSVHQNGTTTFALGPSRNRRALAEGVRRARLMKLSELLDQAGRILTAMESDKPVLDHHAALSDWVRSERDAGSNRTVSPIRSEP